VKQKENIFEELNKMRSLIHTRPGVVISEQDDERLQNLANIQRTVDAQGIIKNPKSQYNNTKWADYIAKFNITQDEIVKSKELTKTQKAETDKAQKRIQNLANIIRMVNADGMIINPSSKFNNTSWSNYIKTYEITQDEIKKANELLKKTASTAEISRIDEMWKDPKVSCVTTQPAVEKNKMTNGSTTYQIGKVIYYSNGRKMLADGTMANYNCSTEFKSRATSNAGGRANVVSSYSKQLQTSLGVTPTGQLSDVEIDLILKRLEGGETGGATPSLDTQSIPMDANGQPDIDKIIASL
jgi:hypothetical protein